MTIGSSAIRSPQSVAITAASGRPRSVEPEELREVVGRARRAPPPLQVGGFVQPRSGVRRADPLQERRHGSQVVETDPMLLSQRAHAPNLRRVRRCRTRHSVRRDDEPRLRRGRGTERGRRRGAPVAGRVAVDARRDLRRRAGPGDAARTSRRGSASPRSRHEERSIRGVSDILRVRGSLSRQPRDRGHLVSSRIVVVGTCRHFACRSPVRSCGIRGIPARCRGRLRLRTSSPGRFLDHWVVEYRHANETGDWCASTPDNLGFEFAAAPEALSESEFLTGGEAWILVPRGREADPSTFRRRRLPE